MLAITEKGVVITKLPLVYFFCAGGILDRLEITCVAEKVRVWKTILLQHGLRTDEDLVMLALPVEYVVIGLSTRTHVFSSIEQGSLRERLGIPHAGQIAFIKSGEAANVMAGSVSFAVSFDKKLGIKIKENMIPAVA